MSDDFPAFALSEEHEALREAVRALADDKIAPRAADVDRTSEFPWDVYEALVKADFQAVHIPEAYGGAGADAIATAIVIEEVARACASSSLIPAVNKLGTVPLMLAGVRGRQGQVPGAGRARRGDVLLRAVRAGGRLGRGGDEDQGGARRRSGYVLNGVKRWITNAGVSKYYTVMAVTDPSAGANGISAFVVEDGRPGLHVRGARAQARHQGLADPGALLRRLRDPGRPADRRRGHGVQDRPAHAGPHPHHDRGAGPRHRPGRARLRARLRQGAQAVRPGRSPTSRACSS